MADAEQQRPHPTAPDQRTEDERTRGNGKPDNRPAEEQEDGDIDQAPIYRRKRVIIPLLILVIVAGGGWWYWNHFVRGFISTDDAMIDANRVSISSKVIGKINFLAVNEGDSVKQGEVLVRLGISDLQAQLAQANAALVAAQQNVILAKVNIDRATDDFNRAEMQYKQKVIPKDQYDHARNALDVANAQYAIANAQVGTAKAQIGVVQTQIQNMEITAPMDGVVSKRWALVGDIVQPGQPILSVYDVRHVWITANFEETKLNVIRLGDTVDVSVDAYPGVPFNGIVYQMGTNTAAQFSLIPPNNASGNYTKVTQRVPIKISIVPARPEDKNLQLLPGMSVDVKIKENNQNQ